MDISVIVVSYNVRDYLSLCLDSLIRSVRLLSGEIIVVDNCSEDGSVEYLKMNYPDVKLMLNSTNVGFGVACNQGLEAAQGKFILFINPDTIIPEDMLVQSIDFLNRREDAGALGVCLIDGTGGILRESKRSIPTLWSSICKFSGLSDRFPQISFFNGYYAPEIEYEEIGEIEVLPGAFMLIRKHILYTLNGFDPRFFMYAEDIDLSYRIKKLGYKIWYNGALKAVHFKGESTKKSLVEYTDTFFSSMKLFIEKYRGELYGNLESTFLLGAVNTILRIKRYWNKVTEKNTSNYKVVEKSPQFGKTLLLSGTEEHLNLLKRQFLFQDLQRVDDSNENISDIIALRYIIPFLWNEKGYTVILDTNSLSFSQIIKIMKKTGEGPIFWLSDLRKGYILSSVERDSQGQSYRIQESISKSKDHGPC